jgi:hypothetical protein
MSRAYQNVLEQRAFEYLSRLDEPDSRLLVSHFRWLAANPHEPGAEEHRASSGRTLQLHLIGHHTLVTWTDHAVRELRIVEIYAD